MSSSSTSLPRKSNIQESNEAQETTMCTISLLILLHPGTMADTLLQTFHTTMPKASKTGGQLLVCSLCPSAKSFSDLSHLLTHLNSKGHLQNKHKLELRCGADPEARDLLDDFARWYNNGGYAEQLTERLQPKTKRKTVKAEKETKVKSRKSSIVRISGISS
jgi:hypothetical protein